MSVIKPVMVLALFVIDPAIPDRESREGDHQGQHEFSEHACHESVVRPFIHRGQILRPDIASMHQTVSSSLPTLQIIYHDGIASGALFRCNVVS